MPLLTGIEEVYCPDGYDSCTKTEFLRRFGLCAVLCFLAMQGARQAC